MRAEVEKSPEFTFINLFKNSYTILGKEGLLFCYIYFVLAATMIVNFLIALIDESNRIAKSIKKDPDFLEFIIFSIKVKII